MREIKIKTRGHFWWASTRIAKGCWGPDDLVAGELTIDKGGRIKLSLDNHLPRLKKPPTGFKRDEENERPPVSGIIDDNRRVYLEGLRWNGASFSSFGPSKENFNALRCLVLPPSESRLPTNFSVASLELELDGFDEWLRNPAITVAQTRSSVRLSTRLNVRLNYDIPNGHLSLQSRIMPRVSGWTKAYGAELSQSTTVVLRHDRLTDMASAVETTSRLEDLLILLTDVERSVPWPTLRIRGVKGFSTLFYLRSKRTQGEIKWHNCWTDVPSLGEHFPVLVSNWLAMVPNYGPAFHMYLGGRRGNSLYIENRFMNIVWGLEALHRKTTPQVAHPRLEKKVERILSSVPEERDRRWLRHALKGASEPSLSVRLKELFLRLPTKIPPDALAKFCDQCGVVRNNISHFAGGRREGSYSDLLKELTLASLPLGHLYHALIMQEIGLPPELMEKIFYHGHVAARLRMEFGLAGLTYDSR